MPDNLMPDGVSAEVARELYPEALKQARLKIVLRFLMTLAFIGVVGTRFVLDPVHRFGGLGFIGIGITSATAFVDAVRRWRKLRAIDPIEAYKQGEL